MANKLKISISGTHSTGKTTLLNDLQKALGDEFITLPGSTRKAKELFGLPINNNEGENYDSTQFFCLAVDLANLYKDEKHNISDRCLLDTVVYSHYLVTKGLLNSLAYNTIRGYWDYYQGNYDFIIIPSMADVELLPDGIRNANDNEFRDEVAAIFKEYVGHLPVNKVIFVNGTPEERVAQAVSAILTSKNLKL
jgi:nicotinamide riboside kinase